MKKWMFPLAVAAVAGVIWYAYYHSVFQHLFLNDAMDYASIARNVARGEGFSSSYITPLSLAVSPVLPHPDLWRAPLWPAALSLFLRFLGNTDQAVAMATGFFFVAGAVMVFLVGTSLFDRLVGVLAALIFIGSAQNLVFGISGMTETMAVFMMLLSVYLITIPRARTWWGDVLAGAALGLFYLTRYNALLFLPFFAGLLWYVRHYDARPISLWDNRSAVRRGVRRRSGLKAVLRYLAAFGVTVSPWLVRNWRLTGSPFFSLQKFEPVMFTDTYPGYSLYTMLEKVDALRFLTTHRAEMWAKIGAGWHEFAGGLLDPAVTGVSPGLFILFLIGLLLPFGMGRLRTGARVVTGLRLNLAACFLVQLAALLVIHFIYRLFFIFMPFYIIFGVAALVWLLRLAAKRLARRGNRAEAAGVILVALFFFGTNLPAWHSAPPEDFLINTQQEAVRAVMNMSRRDGLILSNDGHLLAWYGDRYAAKLPYRVDMVADLDRLVPVNMIYLSSRMSWNIPEVDQGWRELYWAKPARLDGFSLVKTFPDGSVIYRKD